MTLTEAVRTHLLTLSAVTALVGTRIRVLTLGQNDTSAGPAIRLQQIGGAEEMHLRGSVGVRRSRLQVDAYAQQGAADGLNSYASASAVADAVHGDGAGSGLCAFTGTVGGSFEIDVILPASDVREMYEGDELRQVRLSRDYWVWYRG